MESIQNGHNNTNDSPEKKISNEDERPRRSTRGKRTNILTDEQLKEDDVFWKSNPLFKDAFEAEKEEEENDDNENNNDDDIEDEGDSEEDADFEALGDEEEDTSYQLDPEFDEGQNENAEEEEEIDPSKLDLLKKLAANREKHFFHRPIFLKCFIDDCERSNFSYIKLPESCPMLPASNENEISKTVINNKYIGVPPKAPVEYNVIPHCPNFYEYELFKLEDERYHLDSNILKYKSYIETLQKIIEDQDGNTRISRLQRLSKSSKVIRQKLEVTEVEDEIEKLKKIKDDIEHDLENIIKKRDIADINSKTKKETFYQLAIKNREISFAEDDKELYSNGKFIEELSKKHVSVRSLDESSDQNDFWKIYDDNLTFRPQEKLLYNQEKTRNQVKKSVEEFNTSKSASNYILPSELLLFNNQSIVLIAYEMTLIYIKNYQKLYDREKVVNTLKSLFSKTFMNVEFHKLEEVNDTIQEDLLTEYLNELASYNLNKSSEKIDGLDFEVTYNNTPEINSKITYNDKFLPGESTFNENKVSSSFYGTQYFYYTLKYFYSLYQKILIAHALAQKDETKLKKYILLTKAVLVDKLEENKYYLALFNLFGSNGKYLFHVKHLTHQISQTIMSLIYDYLSEKLLNFEKYEPSLESFLKVGGMVRKSRNGLSSEIKHYVYKFCFDSIQNILFVGISKAPEEEFDDASDKNEKIKDPKDESNNKRKEPPENIEDEEPKLKKKVLS